MPSYVINGTLTLGSDPTAPTQAATKGYVDTKVTNIDAGHMRGAASMPAGRMPSLSGDLVANQGGTALNLTSTGVVPGSYTKVRTDSNGRIVEGVSNIVGDYAAHVSFNNILPVSRPNSLSGYGITDAVRTDGTTMLGMVSLSASSFSTTEIINKGFVDSALATAMAGKTIETGDIIARPTVDTPVGYFRCNGGLVSKMTYPGLYAMIGDGQVKQITDMGYGKPWARQYDINLEQTAEITGWTTSLVEPVSIKYSQAVVTKNRVYMLGGKNNTSTLSLILSASINTDGSLGQWVSVGSLPEPLHSSQAVVTRNKVYLIGGHNGTEYVATVYGATVNSDGTIGSFTAVNSLPVRLGSSQAIVVKNHIYTLGGFTVDTASASIYHAVIGDDGALGSWSKSGSLPAAMYGSHSVITKNRVYLLGGFQGSGATTSVYYATLNADGTLGVWTAGEPVPTALFDAKSIVTNGRVYVVSGSFGSSPSEVYTAAVTSDGVIGTWSVGGTLPAKLESGQVFTTKNHIYILGGYDANGVSTVGITASFSGGLNDYSEYYAVPSENILNTGKPWAQQYEINKDQPTAISGWTAGTALPASLKNAQAVITENRAYLIGGSTGASVSSAVYTAPVNTDGTLGTWAVGPSLPQAVSDAQAVVIKDKIFLIGGGNGVTQLNTVYTASIAADGTISSWALASTLPETFSRGQAIVTGPRLYILGGLFAGAPSNKSYFADINSDGTLGSWSLGGNIPRILSDAKLLVAKRNLYLMGGVNDSVVLNTHCRCAILPDGSLGAWSNLMTPVVTNLYGVNSSALPAHVGSAKIVGKGGDGGTLTNVALANGVGGTIPVGVKTVSVVGQGASGTTDVTVHTPTINPGTTGSLVVPVNCSIVSFSGTGGDGASMTATYDGVTYTAPAGNGVPAVIQTWTLPATTNTTKTLTYSVPADGTASLQYIQTVQTTGASTTVTVDGINYTFNGGVGGAATQTSQTVTLSGALAVSYNSVIPAGGSAGLTYQAITTSNGSFSGSGSVNLPATTTRVSMTAKGADGTTTQYVVGSGKPWQQQASFPLSTANANITGWAVNHGAFAGNQSGSSVYVGKDFVYIIGGYSGSSAMSAVYRAPLSGNDIGTWSIVAYLPAGLYNSELIMTFNRLYLLGGYDANGDSGVVYTAAVALDGSVGAWTASTSLPVGISRAKAVVTKNRVYLIGGVIAGQFTANTYTAPINADGTLGTWSSSNPLPGATGRAGVAVTSSRVYILGGLNDTSIKSSVYYADINSSGILGGWQTGAALPQGVRGGETYVTASRVYYFTDSAANGQYGLVYHAPIDASGYIGAWTQGTQAGGTDNVIHVFALQNRLYIVTNNTAGGNHSISYAPISTGGDDYNLMTDGVAATGASSTITLNGTTYTFPGGQGVPAVESTQSVTLPGNASQVMTYSLQTGVTAAVNYDHTPSTSGASTTVTLNGTTYTFAGGVAGPAVETTYNVNFPTTGVSYSNNVPTYGYARLEYETPTSGSALPVATADFTTYVTGNTAYAIGGTQAGTPITTVYTAAIDASGVLSPWATSTSLDSALGGAELIATKTKAYLLGGRNASGVTPAVQYATITGGRNDYSGIYTAAANTTYTPNFKLPDFTSIENSATYYYIKY